MPAYNLCRICLTEDTNTDEMQPLFDENNSRCAEIVKQIEECGGIVLKAHEKYPKMICYQCLQSLQTSCKFRAQCQASEHALLQTIVKSEYKTEPITDLPENEVYFDLRTEFIDAEEVEFSDIADIKEDSDFKPSDEEDYDAGSPLQYEYIIESDTDKEIQNLKHQIKTLSKRKPAKRGRPPKKTTLAQNVKSNRGRKKLVEEPRNIMCEICGNIYTKRSFLNMHMRRHMTKKPFNCEICGKSFACPSELGRHMRVHTGEKPYVCKYCGRTFADRSTNIKHERIHTNERPFACKTCGKSFTYSNVLKNHMLTHTGEKPFPCFPCNKTFSRKHQLDQHISTITHQQTVKHLSNVEDTPETEPEPDDRFITITQQQTMKHNPDDLIDDLITVGTAE